MIKLQTEHTPAGLTLSGQLID